MQPINQYNSNLGVAILLCGAAGSGKTSLGLSMYPKTYVFVTDPNLQSGIDYLKKANKLANVVGFDSAYHDSTGKPIPPNQRYAHMLSCWDKATKDPNVDCIFNDSASFVDEIIRVKVSGMNVDIVQYQGKDTIKMWGDHLVTWKSLVLQLRQSQKKVIFSCHEVKDKDESDGIYKYQLDLGGAMKNQFPKFMTDVWRCEVDEKLGSYTWNLRMLSNARQEHLKRSSMFNSLPAVLKQDDLIKHLQSLK